ncbi:MAG: SGNH/GDSL hydrolase family protein [Lachnospiraceae bacterium]|nr:SGNH/GDSL hydrolase family protein [Lachnospiraceae bacterium]MDE7239582.1 SGNH/GDSL hydrolase family protein [Lachnospiraceae bacterium]
MEANKFIRTFFIGAGALLFAAAAAVAIMDPFYHYHAPIGGMKAVVMKAEYQCIGTVRNFAYDSIVFGSSVAENYNNRWFDEAFGGRTIKGIKSGAATADLVYYMKEAFMARELVNVYYCVDISALNANAAKTFPDASLPLYLYNRNLFDDVQYLWNKTVLFEHIPYELASGLDAGYDEGASYNWAHYKTFSAEGTLSRYDRPETVSDMKKEDENAAVIDANLALIGDVVHAHPETRFRFIFSPYSMLWWDEAYRNGDSDGFLYTVRRAAEYLLVFENVEIYYFQNDAEIITDLDNYMDTIHFSEEINHEIVRRMQAGECRLTLENLDETLAEMAALVIDIEERYMGEYGEW